MPDHGGGARHPRLRADLRVVADGEARVFVLGGGRSLFLEGALYPELLPLLDGTRSEAEVALTLARRAPMAEVARGLARLRALGVLAEGEGLPDRLATAFLDAAGVDPGLAEARRSAALVALACDEGLDPALLEELLGGARLATRRLCPGEDLAAVSLVVVLARDYLGALLLAHNAAAVAAGVPLICAGICGERFAIGPLVVRGSACAACLAQRLRAGRQVEAFIAARGGGTTLAEASPPLLPAGMAAASALLAGEVVRAVVDAEHSPLLSRLATFDPVALRLDSHPVVRLPQCPVCGDPALATRCGEPIVLAERPLAPGRHRLLGPAEVEERLVDQVDPLTGAVSRLIPLEAGPGGPVFSYAAAHSFAVLGSRFDNLRKSMRGSLSGGKGRAPEQARAGALCEALERFVAVWRDDEPRERASYAAVRARAVAPEDIFLYSKDQYANRRPEVEADRFSFVPEPFDHDRPIDWTPAWSLSEGRGVLLPSAHCYYGHPDLSAARFCLADSNGQAAGSCLEEAILQGLYEVVERDSVALWWYNRLRRPGVDLEAVGDPYLENLREYHAGLGRELFALDLTADTGIAAYAVCSRCYDRPSEDIIVGFGAHLDPKAAFDRAVDECNQFLPGVAQRNADGSTRYWAEDAEALRWWREATLESEPYLVPDPAVAPGGLPESAASEDLATDVTEALGRLSRCGLELVVADLTRPDVPLDVVKVVVPTMRHFWRQLAPGRLYEVPVRLGWMAAPLEEAELNPRTIFF